MPPKSPLRAGGVEVSSNLTQYFKNRNNHLNAETDCLALLCPPELMTTQIAPEGEVGFAEDPFADANEYDVEEEYDDEEEEEEEEEVEPLPTPRGPARTVGDQVTLRIGEKALLELNGLKAGEMCTVIFGNDQYDNYKLKCVEDDKEFYWFKSNQLAGDAEREADAEAKAKELASADANVDDARADKERADAAKERPVTAKGGGGGDEGEGGDDEDDAEEKGPKAVLDASPEVDQAPSSTVPKTTTRVVHELFNHTKSAGARSDVLALLDALGSRVRMWPGLLARHHISTFADLHGEAMCLEYLQRTIWREDFILAALVLRVLEPCLQGSDQSCVRFAAAAGREIVEATGRKFSGDRDVRNAVSKVLRYCVVRSARVAKQELVRMRRSMNFCTRCRPAYYKHGLFGTHHPYLCFDQTDDGMVPDHSSPNSVFDRPGYDMNETTEVERSLVPSGDVTFWFGAATVGRYRRDERNGLSRTADKRHRLASALQNQLTGAGGGGASGGGAAAASGTEDGSSPPSPSSPSSPSPPSPSSPSSRGGGPSSLAEAAREEDLEADEALLLERVVATDLTMLTHLTSLLQRFIAEPDVVVAALEVLLHYSVSGDCAAMVEAGVCEALKAAMKQHAPKRAATNSLHHSSSPSWGRMVQWRACACVCRLATRGSDLLKAELGRKEVVDECLEVFSRCPDDRTVQQQAVWAVHYCCLRKATKRRLLGMQDSSGADSFNSGSSGQASPSGSSLGRGSFVKSGSIRQSGQFGGSAKSGGGGAASAQFHPDLVRLLSVLIVLKPQELMVLERERSDATALALKMSTSHTQAPGNHHHEVASGAGKGKQDVGSSRVTSRPASSASLATSEASASDASAVGGRDGRGGGRKRSKMSKEELVRDGICRDLVLPVEMHTMISEHVLRDFLRPVKEKAAAYIPPERTPAAEKAKFGRAK